MQSAILKEFIEGGGLTLRALGNCMAGTFPDGAQLLIERRALYLPGDVVVYARGDDTLVAHRLLGYLPGREGWRVLTRADNIAKADQPTALSRVVGRAVRKDGVALECSFSARIASSLAWFPAVAAWLKQRLANQKVSA
jgi:hypothetical protein